MVTFEPDHGSKSTTQGRTFGQVFYDGKCIAQQLLEEGLASVRTGVPPNDIVNAFIQTENIAKKQGKGQWNADESPQFHVRKITWEPEAGAEAQAVGKQFGTSKTKAIVEQVLNAAVLRCLLLPSYNMVVVAFTGVLPQRAMPGQKPEDFAEQSKFFTERALLHREVTIQFEGAPNQQGTQFLGSVVQGNSCFSPELLSRGYARIQRGTINKTEFKPALEAAEQKAMDGKIGVWKTVQPTAFVTASQGKSSQKLSPAEMGPFTAQVLHVINGDTILVLRPDGKQLKISLSNCKAPKPEFESRKEKSEPGDKNKNKPPPAKTIKYPNWAWDAREFLRKKLVGNTVKLEPDYTRTIQTGPQDETESEIEKAIKKKQNKDKAPEGEQRLCCTVYLDDTNIASQLIEAGLAIVPPGAREGKPDDIALLQQCERFAKSRGRYKDTEAAEATKSYQDLFRPGAKKAQQYFTFLRGGGPNPPKLACIVEQVTSASRFRVLVLNQNCIITLVLAGINAPSNGRKDPDTQKVIEEPQPYGLESTDYAKRNFWHRDGEIEVDNTDSNGTFFGTLYIGKTNVAVEMLEQGLVSTNTQADRARHGSAYEAAKRKAQSAEIGIWSLDEDKRPVEYMSKARRARMGAQTMGRLIFESSPALPCTVTEIVDCTHIWVQLRTPENQATMRSVESLLAGLQLNNSTHKTGIKVDDMVVARFTADDQLYRAKVTRAAGDRFHVTYIDYGNSEMVNKDRIWKVQSVADHWKTNPQQAVPFTLAFLAELPSDTDLIDPSEVGYTVREYVADPSRPISVQVVYTEEGAKKPTRYVVVRGAQDEPSLQATILRKGLGRMRHCFLTSGKYMKDADTKAKIGAIAKELELAENQAKREHLCVWAHGDPFESDED
eukprot:TRINITY_DN68098_c6_g2_i1.p1 TRINITY_DN68098_c6_g2~~TRINITY_DN68098_c6_g2_i1.p1  ORF type:complete len:971 (-),score=107.02 TRINITY_DN68098_c6_g2_i1:1563-4232(-)